MGGPPWRQSSTMAGTNKERNDVRWSFPAVKETNSDITRRQGKPAARQSFAAQFQCRHAEATLASIAKGASLGTSRARKSNDGGAQSYDDSC